MYTSCPSRSIRRAAPIRDKRTGTVIRMVPIIIMVVAMTTRQHISAVAIMMALTTLLPEMLSGNTPVNMMVNPAVFFFYLFAYGLPVLVIREFVVRNAIGFAGLFLLGLAYGIINEALFAKTVFLQTGIPVDVYDGYGFAFGIQWAWTAFILPWHAIASVILPISFSHQFVPEAAGKSWLGKRLALGLAALLLVLISVFYLYEDTSPLPRSPQMLILLWGSIGTLALVAVRLGPMRKLGTVAFSKWRQIALGFSGIVPFLSLLVVANMRWPYIAYLAVVFGWIALYRFLIRHFADIDLPAFGWFGLGWYMHIGVFSWLGIAVKNPMVIVADGVVFAILWWMMRRAERIVA